MAQSSEHKMLFDVRGRRRRVIQVVYALLAFIMAASLFFVVGPVDLSSVVGGSASDARGPIDDQLEKVERQLAQDPQNEELLLRDLRLRTSAAQTETETDSATGSTTITEQGVEDLNQAADAWIRYMKLNPQDPKASDAQLAVNAISSTPVSYAQLEERARIAAEAQAIVAETRPSANSYLVLTQFLYYAGDEQAAERAAERAKQEAPAQQRKFVEQATESYRKQGEQLRRQAERAAKAQGAAGKEALESPLGSLSGGGSGSASP